MLLIDATNTMFDLSRNISMKPIYSDISASNPVAPFISARFAGLNESIRIKFVTNEDMVNFLSIYRNHFANINIKTYTAIPQKEES